MSKESAEWLNSKTLIGFTSQRGNAWHYRKELQGDESNHYENEIPLADVIRRLFFWRPIELPLYANAPASLDDMTGIDSDGIPFRQIEIPGKKVITASDTHEVLGVVGSNYKPHPYDEWLVSNVAQMVGGDIAVSSAGLLKNRSIAWVEISVPETLSVAGVSYRPNLLACTSLDGTTATTYKRTVTLTVCDNTLAAALNENGESIKVRHTANAMR